MRTTITVDDELVAKAVSYSGIEEKSRLVSYVLEDFVKRKAAKRLAALGGTMPDLVVPGRTVSYVGIEAPLTGVAEDTK